VAPVSQRSSTPNIAASKLFGGSNRGPEILIGRDKELADLVAAWSRTNEAVTHLVELNLIEEQPWEPRRIVGYSEGRGKIGISELTQQRQQ
jgi:hypothetical protein